MTKEQRELVLNYVKWRLSQTAKLPAARYEFIILSDGNRVALPSEQVIGEIQLNGKTVRIRTDRVGRLVYGTKVKTGRKSRILDEEMSRKFAEAFGNLLRIVKEE